MWVRLSNQDGLELGLIAANLLHHVDQWVGLSSSGNSWQPVEVHLSEIHLLIWVARKLQCRENIILRGLHLGRTKAVLKNTEIILQGSRQAHECWANQEKIQWQVLSRSLHLDIQTPLNWCSYGHFFTLPSQLSQAASETCLMNLQRKVGKPTLTAPEEGPGFSITWGLVCLCSASGEKRKLFFYLAVDWGSGCVTEITKFRMDSSTLHLNP